MKTIDGQLEIDPVNPPTLGRIMFSGPGIFVWGIWGLMFLSTFLFVKEYASNVPFFDEWAMVPTMAGMQPVTLQFLWSQHNEHRIPLPRLVLLGLGRITHCDFRAGLFFNLFALAGLSAVLALMARHLRGGTSYADAFFPLAFLHWGHRMMLLWSFQIVFVLAATLVCGLLIGLAYSSGRRSFPGILLAGVCLILLPLCGASGLPFVPPLALWFGVVGFRYWRSGLPSFKWRALVTGSFIVIPLVETVCYYYNFQKDQEHGGNPGVRASLKTALEFLTMGFGTGGVNYWPKAGLLFLLLGGASAAVFLIAWRYQPEHRLSLFGFLMVLGSYLALAIGVGWGRAYIGENAGLSDRYVTLALPVLCCMFFIFTLCRFSSVGQLGQMGLFSLFCVLLPLNNQEGLSWARVHRQHMKAFEQDLRSPVPFSLLAERHIEICPSLGVMIPLVEALCRADIGPFHPVDKKGFVQENFLVDPVSVHQMTWEKGKGQGTGNDPYLVFSLPQPRWVYGIRLTFNLSNPAGEPSSFQLFWKRKNQEFQGSERVQNMLVETGPKEQTITLWINDTIDQFRIDPDMKPCIFQLSAIQLLTLPEGQGG